MLLIFHALVVHRTSRAHVGVCDTGVVTLELGCRRGLGGYESIGLNSGESSGCSGNSWIPVLPFLEANNESWRCLERIGSGIESNDLINSLT